MMGMLSKKFQPSIFYGSQENYVSPFWWLTNRWPDIVNYRVALLVKIYAAKII